MFEVWIRGQPPREASNLAHAELLAKDAFRADAGAVREVYIVRVTPVSQAVVRTVKRETLH